MDQLTITIGTQKNLLGLLCASVLAIILTAGLWPFHAPKNDVTWLSASNGIHFGNHSVILSPNALGLVGLRDATSCSIEIWLQPANVEVGGTILVFYKPETRTVGFALHQSIDDLFLRRGTYPRHVKARFYVSQLFHKSKQPFVTITSGAQGTAVYLNGVLARISPQFGLTGEDLTGQLVVGNNPLADDGWQGQVRGLATYDRELTAAEVLQHYGVWTTKQGADIKNDDPAALYLFNEGMGNVVHDQANSGMDLQIPERYFVLRAPFLERPWDEFSPTWSYCKDVLINIGGFVPLGFFFCAYFASVRRINRAALATIVLGGVVSLTIEVLQAFLPTRDSGMTDLITNTLGTGIGTALYSSKSVQGLLATVGLEGVRRPLISDGS